MLLAFFSRTLLCHGVALPSLPCKTLYLCVAVCFLPLLKLRLVDALFLLLASSPAVYVEYKKEEDSTYEAVCDVSERMSCSKVWITAGRCVRLCGWRWNINCGLVERFHEAVRTTNPPFPRYEAGNQQDPQVRG